MSETLRDELLKKVRRIEISTRKVIDDFMSGQYRSHFKGHGVQFSEHRLYVPGDDVRHIDWKASARSRDPLVKKYEEERELTVLLVVDLSASESFGTEHRLKSEVVAEISSMLAYAAVLNGDRVGAVLFTDQVEKVIPPKKGKQHVLRIVHDLLSFKPKGRGTEIGDALDSAGRILKHAGIVFVVSDFMGDGFDKPLQKLARRHDVVAIRITDPKEKSLPAGETFTFFDPESGLETVVNTGSYAFKNWFSGAVRKKEEELVGRFKKTRIQFLDLLTPDDYGEALVRFFQKRRRR